MGSDKNSLNDTDSISNRISWCVLRQTDLKRGTFIPVSQFMF